MDFLILTIAGKASARYVIQILTSDSPVNIAVELSDNDVTVASSGVNKQSNVSRFNVSRI